MLVAATVLGAYLMVGCLLSMWAWFSYAKEMCAHLGQDFNKRAFVMYTVFWPRYLAMDWKRLFRR